MAVNNSGATFEGIMKDLRARKFKPVYFLVGNEPYYIDLITDYIADNAIEAEQRDFNQIVMYGLDTTPVRVMDAAHAVPMMAEYQVVIVKEAQMMKGIEKLEKYVRNPIASTILVVCYKDDAPKAKKGLFAEAQKNAVYFESNKLRDYKLPDFITSYLKGKGCEIEQKAVAMISESIGNDLSRIVSELDKLFLTLPKGEHRIIPEYVERQIGISKEYNVYELRDAIIKKDVVKANRIVNYFDKNPKAGNLHSIVQSLFVFFQNLMLAFYCPQKQKEEDLAAWLGLHSGWAARDYVLAMKRYNAQKTLYIIRMLRTTIAKGNGLDNRSATDIELMRELMFFILH